MFHNLQYSVFPFDSNLTKCIGGFRTQQEELKSKIVTNKNGKNLALYIRVVVDLMMLVIGQAVKLAVIQCGFKMNDDGYRYVRTHILHMCTYNCTHVRTSIFATAKIRITP